MIRVTLDVTDLTIAQRDADAAAAADRAQRELDWIWDRIEDPTPAADGTAPEQDDFRTTVGMMELCPWRAYSTAALPMA